MPSSQRRHQEPSFRFVDEWVGTPETYSPLHGCSASNVSFLDLSQIEFEAERTAIGLVYSMHG